MSSVSPPHPFGRSPKKTLIPFLYRFSTLLTFLLQPPQLLRVSFFRLSTLSASHTAWKDTEKQKPYPSPPYHPSIHIIWYSGTAVLIYLTLVLIIFFDPSPIVSDTSDEMLPVTATRYFRRHFVFCPPPPAASHACIRASILVARTRIHPV